MAFTYEYPRPALAVDCVVFGYDKTGLQILLIKRGIEPFKGDWALPGGFVKPEESLDEAARRELVEETGVEDIFMEQLYTFGAVDRDPRERVISVSYFALIPPASKALKATTDATEAAWFPIEKVPSLAFDHETILACARDRLRAKVRYQPVGFELLSEKFTLTQLQRLYEAVLGRELDKRNFRKKLFKMDLVMETEEYETGVSHRAARFYRFDREKYDRLVAEGFSFDL